MVLERWIGRKMEAMRFFLMALVGQWHAFGSLSVLDSSSVHTYALHLEETLITSVFIKLPEY